MSPSHWTTMAKRLSRTISLCLCVAKYNQCRHLAFSISYCSSLANVIIAPKRRMWVDVVCKMMIMQWSKKTARQAANNAVVTTVRRPTVSQQWLRSDVNNVQQCVTSRRHVKIANTPTKRHSVHCFHWVKSLCAMSKREPRTTRHVAPHQLFVFATEMLCVCFCSWISVCVCGVHYLRISGWWCISLSR